MLFYKCYSYHKKKYICYHIYSKHPLMRYFLTVFSLFFSIVICAQSPVFDFSADVTSGCTPLQVTFLNETDNAYKNKYRYEWIVEPGKFSPETDMVENTYVTAGMYSCSMRVYDAENKLVETVSKPDYISVFRDPSVTITSDKSKTCMHLPVQFSVDEVDTDAPIQQWKWVISDGTSYYGETIPPHSFLYPDTFSAFVTVTDTNGCVNRIRQNVEVAVFDDYPQTMFDVDKAVACESSLAVNFLNTTIPNTASFTWNFGDGTTSTESAVKHTYNGFGTYMAELTAVSPNGCVRSSDRSIRLIDYSVDFSVEDELKTIQDGAMACEGTLEFSAMVTPTTPSNTYFWDFENNGTVDGTKSFYEKSVLAGQSYTMKLKATNGFCTDSIVKTIMVEPPLNLSYSAQKTFFCELPANVTYTAHSDVPGTQFSWKLHEVDSERSGSPMSYVYTAYGKYSETLYGVSPNQCSDSIEKQQHIWIPNHVLNISPTSRISGCVPLTVDFSHVFSYAAQSIDPIKSIQWDFDSDGVIDETGEGPYSYEFTNTGVYSAKIQVETDSGCVFTNATTNIPMELVTVGALPSADLVFPDTLVCSITELQTLFVPDDATRYTSAYDTLVVTFMPDTIIYSPIATVQIPPNDFEVQLRDTIGPHKVFYSLSDHGCREDFVDSTDGKVTEIHVKGPIVEIMSSPQNCNDNYNYDYYVNKLINIDTSKATQYYEWYLSRRINNAEFGRKKIAKNTKNIHINYDHDTLGRGQYVVTLVAYNYDDICDDAECYDGICVDSVKLFTHVTDIKAGYTLQRTTPCLHDAAVFVRLPEPHSYDVHQSYWRYTHDSVFVWPIKSDEDSIFYVFNSQDITSVEVISHDIYGCADTTFIPVKVYQPQAAFFADIVSDCLPFVSQFTDTTVSDTLIVARTWTFGNGKTAYNDSIVSTEYAAEGLTSPKLMVRDVLGCESEYMAANYIRPVVPNARFIVANPKLCLNHEGMFVRNTTDPNYDNNIHKLLWDFGDGSTNDSSLDDTVKHKYSTESPLNQTFDVSFTAYSMSPEGNECVASSTGKIEVKDVAAQINYIGMDDCKEPGQPFVVDLNSIWYNRYDTVDWWKVEDGDSLYVSNRKKLSVIFFNSYGNQEVYLRTTSPYYGCEIDTAKMIVHVPGFIADFSVDKDVVCVGDEIKFTLHDTANIYRYEHYFEFGDGTARVTSDFDNVVHSYTVLPDNVDNTFPAQFIVKADGCLTPPLVKNIEVIPVMADFIRGNLDIDTIGCAPYTVSFINTSEGLTNNNYEWHFGDGTSSTEKNPTHTFQDVDSMYMVSLSLSSAACSHAVQKPIYTYPLANISYIVDTAICFGTTIPIEAVGNFTSIQWNPAEYFENSFEAKTNVSLPYSMFVKAALESPFGCESVDSVFIYVQQKPYYLGAPDSLLLYYFTEDSLRFTSDVSSNLIVGETYNVNNIIIDGVLYSWTPAEYLSCDDCGNPDIDLRCGIPGFPNCLDFPETVDYTITMTDRLGCFENTETITFSIILETKAALPQAFTPNNDGVNDFAFVRGWGIKEFLELRIYNRWGQQVFMTTNIEKGWDGTFRGEPQNADTYAYTIKVINTNNEEEFIKGYITLLR